MKKLILSTLTVLALSAGINAQNVNIPDASFKANLVGNSAINTNGDTEIQVSEASSFTGIIDCPFASIVDLTGIQEFVLLTELYCDNNNITSLDLSNNTNLVRLNCSFNNLSSLNVANGNNSNFTYFGALYNPNLTCIQVDDVTYSTANWTDIDATASFSTNCTAGGVGINEVNILDLKIYPNPVSNILFIQLGENKSTEMNILSLSGKVVKSIANNNVKSIDVSDLVQGIYILKVVTDKGVSTTRIIKQ
jgi:Leucine-rich repeat (LRR) protein